MTKRYGRQQKRKAKALLQEKQEECNNLKDKLQWRSDTISQAEQIIDAVTAINPDSVLLPPKRYNGRVSNLTAGFLGDTPTPYGNGSAPCNLEMNVVNLHELEVVLQETLREDAVHIRTYLDNGAVGYSVSRSGIKYISVESLGGEIATLLKQEITKL